MRRKEFLCGFFKKRFTERELKKLGRYGILLNMTDFGEGG